MSAALGMFGVCLDSGIVFTVRIFKYNIYGEQLGIVFSRSAHFLISARRSRLPNERRSESASMNSLFTRFAGSREHGYAEKGSLRFSI